MRRCIVKAGRLTGFLGRTAASQGRHDCFAGVKDNVIDDQGVTS